LAHSAVYERIASAPFAAQATRSRTWTRAEENHMVHRGIATLAGLLVFCYLILSALEPPFFLLHLYQSVIYLVIILMLFYLEDHWAYMLGMMAPTAWLIIAFGLGILQTSALAWLHLPQMVRLGVNNQVSLVAGVIAVLSVLMIIFCARHWKREFAGEGKGLHTFVFSLIIVIGYYVILALWFAKSIPGQS
jgi:hypothetical protein